MATCTLENWINSLWPSDVKWWPRAESVLVQVLACCLIAPNYSISQCWLIIEGVLCHWPVRNFTRSAHELYPLHVFQDLGQWVSSLWPSNVIWWHTSGSTLAQVMACCLMAPSHYLNRCRFIIGKVQWHSSEGKVPLRSITKASFEISIWNFIQVSLGSRS